MRKEVEIILTSGLPSIHQLSNEERYEYVQLVEILQNMTGIQFIAHNATVMFDKDCKVFTTRIRDLLIKDQKSRIV